MKAKSIDPQRLDVAALAAEAGELSGEWPLASLDRLSASAMPEASPQAVVSWSVQGELRPVTGGQAEVWLHLRAGIHLALCCQRCLGPVLDTVTLDRALRFVADERQAAELDAEMEDDVLALERELDVRELVEDELLLALPLVPRHTQCPAPLPLPADEPEVAERPNPFAALAALKRQGGGGGD
jgi:uncharacterized protein